MRLFCFPYAGGGASVYAPWREALSEIEVLPVKLPGREGRLREQPFRRADTLVEQLTESLRPFLGSPFAFFGHSMGAIIAAELARRVEREGAQPVRTFVSGRESPELSGPIDDAYRLGDDVLIEVLTRLGATPPEILDDAEILKLFLPTLRADFELIGTYRHEPSPLLACPVSTFYAEGDGEGYDSVKGWQHTTRGAWKAVGFSGNHFFPFGSSRDRVLDAIANDLGVAR